MFFEIRSSLYTYTISFSNLLALIQARSQSKRSRRRKVFQGELRMIPFNMKDREIKLVKKYLQRGSNYLAVWQSPLLFPTGYGPALNGKEIEIFYSITNIITEFFFSSAFEYKIYNILYSFYIFFFFTKLKRIVM